MPKIKEIPIDDTLGASQFKEGDSIITYTENYRQRIETVGSIEEEHIVTLDGGHIHYKCCRKIEYIEPREFWVNFKKCIVAQYDTDSKSEDGWIHVREVIDESN